MGKLRAGLFLTIGLLAGSIAWSGWALDQSIFDKDRMVAVAGEVLSSDGVKEELSEKIQGQMAQQLPGPAVTDKQKLEQGADLAVEDPRFQAALSEAIVAIQDRIVNGTDTKVVLNTMTITDASVGGLSAVDPQLGAALQNTGKPVEVTLDTGVLPSLSSRVDFIRTTYRIAALVALAALTLGFMFTSDRAGAFARVARWILVVGIVQLVATWAIPRGLIALSAGWSEILGRALLELLQDVRVVAEIATLCAVLMLIGVAVFRRQQRHTSIPSDNATSPNRFSTHPWHV